MRSWKAWLAIAVIGSLGALLLWLGQAIVVRAERAGGERVDVTVQRRLFGLVALSTETARDVVKADVYVVWNRSGTGGKQSRGSTLALELSRRDGAVVRRTRFGPSFGTQPVEMAQLIAEFIQRPHPSSPLTTWWMPWLVNLTSIPFVLIFGAIVGEVILRKVGRLKPVLVLICVTSFAIAVAAQPRRATPPGGLAQQIVGAWNLESRTVTRADGTSINDPVLGQKPLGRLFYDASGVMMLQMMRQGRSAAVSTPANPKDAANPRIVLGYDAYFGRYTVDERAGTVTHHVEGSLFPEDLGDDWVRPITIKGDTLTLRFTSTADGSAITRTLTFRRSK